jgi:hypothetical protein
MAPSCASFATGTVAERTAVTRRERGRNQGPMPLREEYERLLAVQNRLLELYVAQREAREAGDAERVKMLAGEIEQAEAERDAMRPARRGGQDNKS